MSLSFKLPALAAAGALALSGFGAFAQTAPPSMSAMGGMGAMGGHAGMHGDMMSRMQAMLDAVGATADQKARIAAILHAGFTPLMGLHTEMQQAHASLHALITAPVIDRAALEQLRAREMAALDAASRTLVKSIADAADVLTPAQRAKAAAMMGKAPAGM